MHSGVCAQPTVAVRQSLVSSPVARRAGKGIHSSRWSRDWIPFHRLWLARDDTVTSPTLRAPPETPHNVRMEWTDEGIILGARRHGENSVILEAMTRHHGRHLGIVRGGRSARFGPVLQPGNTVSLVWRARLDEHLGQYSVEGLNLRAGQLMPQAASLYGLTHMASLVRLLAEREPHEGLYAALDVVLGHLDVPGIAAPLVVRFELELLAELGFGLDLASCAVTGGTQELIYVSPKTGRAVSARAGAAYADRLLALPTFVREGFLGDGITAAEMADGFALTGFFLQRHVYEPRGMLALDERAAFAAAVARTG